MGFETQEDAERFSENAEFVADQRREEMLLLTPKERAWRRLIELPAYKSISPAARVLQRTVFDYAWEAAKKSI